MVTTSPVAWKTLPRTSGSATTDTPAVQSLYATGVDNNFTAFNTWAKTWEARYKVTKVSNAALLKFNVPNFTPYEDIVDVPTTYADGLIQDEVRYLSIATRWEGVGAVDADSYGGITDQKICTLVDKRFWPGGGQEIAFTGSWGGTYSAGTAAFRLDAAGAIWVVGISEKWGTLSLNDYFLMAFSYMTWGT